MAVSGKHLFSTEVVLFFFIHGLKPVATKLVDPMGLAGGGVAVFAAGVVFTPTGCNVNSNTANSTLKSAIQNHQSEIANAVGFRLHPSGVQCE